MDTISLLAYLLLHSTMPIVVAVVTAMAMMTTTMMTLATIAGDVCPFAEELCIMIATLQKKLHNTEKYCHKPNIRRFVGCRV